MTTVTMIWLVAAAVQAAAPQIQNGRVESRPVTSIERDVARLGGGADPAWIVWRVPMVDGDRRLCSTWSDGQVTVRGADLEPRPSNTPPVFAAPTGPTSLEAGSGLLVLVRTVDGAAERLRTLGDDCPIDAGGRAVYWLTGVTPADSLRYLESLTRQDNLNIDGRRRLAESAVSAIGFHRDPAADAILDGLTAPAADAALRRQAAGVMASARGAHGFMALTRLIAAERDPNVRRSFVRSLAETHQPGTEAALLALARGDADAQARGDAVYGYAQRAGAAGSSDVAAIIDHDADDNVKRRAVSGIATMPPNASVPLLIGLARTGPNLAVRKEAVSALGQIHDARASAFLEELVGK